MRISGLLDMPIQNIRPKPGQAGTGARFDIGIVLGDTDDRQIILQRAPESANNLGNQSTNDRAQNDNNLHQNELQTRVENSPPSEPPEAEETIDESAETVLYAYSDESSNETDEILVSDEEILAVMASILQVPVETVQALLEQLDITPKDLLEPKAVASVLEKFLGVESPAQLLTNEDFPALFKAANEAVKNLASQAAEASVAAEVLPVYTETMTSTKVPVLTGLQVVKEDDQLIVTEIPDEDTTETAIPRTREVSTHSPPDENQSESGLLSSNGGTPVFEASENTLPEYTPITVADSSVKIQTEVIRQTAAAAPVNPTDVIEQILSQVKLVNLGGQVSEMRLTLKPESLGDIILRVMTQNGIVVAQFLAESQRVKETLESNFNQLRDSLEEQGIKFSELSVSVGGDGSEARNHFEQARQRLRHRMESLTNAAPEDEETEQIDPFFDGTINVTA